MDEQLVQLISDYQRAVSTAVLLMSESGIESPSNIKDLLHLDIPAHGELNGGIRYFKHGFGYRVHLPEGKVEFDFGEHGEIDGFDEWRLWQFCQQHPSAYAFDTQQSLSVFIKHALEKKQLVASAHNLYYVADSIKLLGDKVANILKEGCALPHKTRDSVLTLASQCFESADLMLRHYEEINQLLEKEKKLNNANGIKFRVYLLSWLGYLHTTADGFKSLNMRLLLQKKRPAGFLELVAKCNELGKLEKRHANELRELRNNIFHLRTNDKAISHFFSEEGKRIEWARGLHAAFSSFFSDYRIIAEVHYLCSGRLGESQIRQESMNRRKKV